MLAEKDTQAFFCTGHVDVEVSTMFQAGLIEHVHVHLSVDIESSNFWRSNMKEIRLGNNVIFVSSYAAGKPTHTHKAETSVWLLAHSSRNEPPPSTKKPPTGHLNISWYWLGIPFSKPPLNLRCKTRMTISIEQSPNLNLTCKVHVPWVG
jgi:hypothetical protein